MKLIAFNTFSDISQTDQLVRSLAKQEKHEVVARCSSVSDAAGLD